MKAVLVIDNDSSHNWYKLLGSHTFETAGGGQQPIRVEQCGWQNITIVKASPNPNEGCVVDITPSEDPIFGTNQNECRTCRVDFVLVRNYPRALHEQDYRSILLGLNYALLPAVNSLFSIFCATERALLNAELNRLAREHGSDFPFVESFMVGNIGAGTLAVPRSFPAVVKVGSSCAGYGKMLVHDSKQFQDLQSILVMGREYYTVERFVPSSHDIRLTRVGRKNYVYQRECIGSGSEDVWKRNTGNTKHTLLEMTPRYVKMLDIASGLFGGLDIVTVDLLALEDGSDVVLEINDSASGFDDSQLEDDHRVLVELIKTKLTESFGSLAEYQESACVEQHDAAVEVKKQGSQRLNLMAALGDSSKAVKLPRTRKCHKPRRVQQNVRVEGSRQHKT